MIEEKILRIEDKTAYARGITCKVGLMSGTGVDVVSAELNDVPLTGGGGDGTFTAALGIPTLDGLSADGKGTHAAYEQIYFSSLMPRTYLACGCWKNAGAAQGGPKTLGITNLLQV
jgi:hypothetical protein